LHSSKIFRQSSGSFRSSPSLLPAKIGTIPVYRVSSSRRETPRSSGNRAATRNRDIAIKLFIPEETVKIHVKLIMEKLDAMDGTQAATIAFRCGFIPL
jgi:hypothetical protein